MGTNAVVGVVGTMASLVGLFITISSIGRRRRRGSRRRITTVRYWRLVNYDLALAQLRDMIGRWQRNEFDADNRRGFVTEYDLLRWIIQLALTCAANIGPQSLGKASLFRIGEIERDSQTRLTRVRVYSFELDGIFSADQMLDRMNPRLMRDISISPDGQDGHNFPAALQCVNDKGPTVQSLRLRASKFDSPERRLGLTHILAIPLRSDLADAQPDQPVSITVDLRFSGPIGYLVDHFNLHCRTLIGRAEQISQALRPVTALHKPEFLPPPTPDRGS